MGTDWILKFSIDPAVDESLECMQAALTDMVSDASRVVFAAMGNDYSSHT